MNDIPTGDDPPPKENGDPVIKVKVPFDATWNTDTLSVRLLAVANNVQSVLNATSKGNSPPPTENGELVTKIRVPFDAIWNTDTS